MRAQALTQLRIGVEYHYHNETLDLMSQAYRALGPHPRRLKLSTISISDRFDLFRI
jgi:hypothetical protein